MESDGPSFPPLLRGEQAPKGVDPFSKAIAYAANGVDPGLIVHNLTPETLEAAIVFAPESDLETAMGVLLALQLGFADALGALAPPEVGVHFFWPGGLMINGAHCGKFRAAASTNNADEEPDWLVLGLVLPIHPGIDSDPGRNPEVTTLIEEGCADVAPTQLLESWSRHALVWIHRFSDEGLAPLHADWRSRALKMGEEISLEIKGVTVAGTFVGVDEKGGLLLRSDDETRLFPLSTMLEN